MKPVLKIVIKSCFLSWLFSCFDVVFYRSIIKLFLIVVRSWSLLVHKPKWYGKLLWLVLSFFAFRIIIENSASEWLTEWVGLTKQWKLWQKNFYININGWNLKIILTIIITTIKVESEILVNLKMWERNLIKLLFSSGRVLVFLKLRMDVHVCVCLSLTVFVLYLCLQISGGFAYSLMFVFSFFFLQNKEIKEI